MKLKKIGAIIAGAIIIVATFTFAVASETMDVDRSFFIDEKTGRNNCLVIVGADAAAADVVSASMISAQIGSMAYYTKVIEHSYNAGTKTPGSESFEEKMPNYKNGGNADVFFDDFRDVLISPASSVVLPYSCSSSYISLDEFGIDVTGPLWDYDVAIKLSDRRYSYEIVTIDFSPKGPGCIGAPLDAALTCCGQKDLKIVAPTNDPQDDMLNYSDLGGMLDKCQTYPNIYPRHYWGMPSNHLNWPSQMNDLCCDPIGGISYRTIVDGKLPFTTAKYWDAIICPEGKTYNVCCQNTPVPVRLFCNTCPVYFFGEVYDAISFGTDANGYDYMLYGTPEWHIGEIFYSGEAKEYANGWTLVIDDLGVYENSANITIISPDGTKYQHIMVSNARTSQFPSEGEGDFVIGTNEPNEKNDAIAYIQNTFDIYSLCGAKTGKTLTVEPYYEEENADGEVVFAVKCSSMMIGASGKYIVKCHVYTLAGCGALKEQLYPGICGAKDGPAVRAGDLEWYFDIVPGDDIDVNDLDNAISLWENGNPNFDAADSLTIYDSGTNTPLCVPCLELWLETPVERTASCNGTALKVALDYCSGENFFTIEVLDEFPHDYRIDGEIKRYIVVPKPPETAICHMDIDPEKLVKLDYEITPKLIEEHNLILIGGPAANTIVKTLVGSKYTSDEKWATSGGEMELLKDVYATGKDILIVAGKDREGTHLAACNLVEMLLEAPISGTCIKIDSVNYNDGSSLNDEYVAFKNEGALAVDMAGWKVINKKGHTFVFPKGFDIGPDSKITLHSGYGTNTSTDLYWKSATDIWDNAGDQVLLIDSKNILVASFLYNS
ncbi:MAG: S-layer protein [Candidatus Methanofastidiosia archaeon]